MSNSQVIKINCTDEELSLITKNLTSRRRAELLLRAAKEAEERFSNLMVVGYVKCDRVGELDEADCPECDMPLRTHGNPWIVFRTDGTFVYLCGACATSE